MKRKIRLTESDLQNIVRDVISEEIRKGNLDEGFWSQLGAGLKGAFGGDARRAGQAASNMGNAIGNAYNSARNAVSNAYNNVRNAVGNAAGEFAQGVKGRYNAFQNTRQYQQRIEKLESLYNQCEQLLNDGTIGGAPKLRQIMGQFMSKLGSYIGTERGGQTQVAY